jgi:site-specific recombinase XerD
MTRRVRATDLETRTGRLKLPVAKKPTWVRIGLGIGIGYRRNQGPGTWSGRTADGKGGYATFSIAVADDFDTANGGTVMDFWQAQDRIRAIGLSARQGDAGKLAKVGEAVDAYEEELKRRGGDVYNAWRIRAHLPASLAAKTVATLVARDFKAWRDALTKARLTPDTVNRTNTCLKACLNLAADDDERIANRRSWEKALAGIRDAGQSRNVILTDTEVAGVVTAAYEISPEFGLLVEVAATTGARVSRLANLTVMDLQDDRAAPRLTMPTSRKGRGRKVERRPVPITPSLAAKLRAASGDRRAGAPLLVKQNGDRWRHANHGHPFQQAAAAAGLDPSVVTLGALRHSSIVRELLANVPIRIVATKHDTSTAMVEKTYSKYIGDFADALSRKALLDLSAPVSGNVVSLGGRQ